MIISCYFIINNINIQIDIIQIKPYNYGKYMIFIHSINAVCMFIELPQTKERIAQLNFLHAYKFF